MHVAALRNSQRQRLFAQHVLAKLGGAYCPLGVYPIRKRDVDGVDVGVTEQGFVARVVFRYAGRFGKDARAFAVAARDGEKGAVG
jgi:hypothetical protein